MTKFSGLKWLYPGMRVKRWLLLATFGVLLITAAGLGLALIANMAVFDLVGDINNFFRLHTGQPAAAVVLPLSLVLLGGGMLCLGFGIRGAVISVASAVSPQAARGLADAVFRTRYLQQGSNIVVIGGGTGLSTMLRGLKEYTSNITAVVTVSDDGGSSGRLQRELGVLPPGDIRNCLVALADAEPLMRDVFQHRFNGEVSGLAGHSLGNLFLVAITQLRQGDFEQAVKDAAEVLRIRGNVLPSTVERVSLRAVMADGAVIQGESNIEKGKGPVAQVALTPENPKPVADAVEAIRRADLIVLGPGSVFTSVIPNLLIPGISEAIARSKALRVYICNVMTQPGETDGFKASDHVRAVSEHAGRRVFDYVLVNERVPRRDLLAKYEVQGQVRVEPDVEKIRQMGFKCIVGDFISETNLVRHDPEKLARAIARLVE
ncbi:MAG TPA: YvcK family protein [Armatimonadota bacterium]|nr:YvcK family protein [Armatimonadota bacterium]HOM80303.1 YvcK family protein [Armatimonadota bacterium]HOQ28392.1 YvcK family protein [Armatimonadota bacterium]HPO71304.1 YvcK family protein [Armatimonadota bacterium]HPT98504.1 YvcK family protein [Armatimonadota bacterium]